MVSRYKLTMCRLCLSENECFINIFEMNDWQGYVAADVMSDLLQFKIKISPLIVKFCKAQVSSTWYPWSVLFNRENALEIHLVQFLKVSEADVYPHVVCLTCLTKLTDFKMFKECCQKSKVTYDDMFGSDESLVECEPERNDMKTFNLQTKDEDIDFNEVELTLVETVTHPKYLQCLENKKPHSTSNGEVDVDSRSSDDSILEKSKSISLCEVVEASSSGTMARLDGQEILQGESINKVPLIQQDIIIGKEVNKERGRMEEDIGGEGKGWNRAGPGKGVIERIECFSEKGTLVEHMRINTGCKLYKCAECSKSFSKNSTLKVHMRTHTGSKPYQCAECSKCFSQNSSLNTHMKTHTGSKPYKCAECSKFFSQNGSLQRHMRLHAGIKPYKCAECSKSFCEKGHLTTHMRTHTGSKPYKCAECSKSFRHSSYLNTHIRIHTGSKTYKCAECGKCFSLNSTLKGHMRTHTGSKPYKCVECSKSFSRSSSLKTHMRRIHRI